MAGITALGTTYNLPNYTGILYALTPADTAFFSAIGGLNGGGQTTSAQFEWETYDLGTPGQNVVLEGADAPTLEGRVRAAVTNVCQIQHRAVGVSYSKQALFGQKAGLANDATNPVRNERDWQIEQALKGMVRDINYSFINGAYQLPVDNTTARQTRGMLAAITTNVVTATETIVGNGASTWEADDEVITEATHGLAVGDRVRIAITSGATGATAGYFWVVSVPSSSTFTVSTTKGGSAQAISADGVVDVYKTTALSVANINNLARTVWEAGGIMEGDTATLVTNSYGKLQISEAFGNAYGKYQEMSRNIGGVNVSTIVTDFGTLNVMLDRQMPQGTLMLASLEQCQPVYVEVPDKGHFFAEPLAKTGATDRVQLYGEVGLAYGNQLAHGKIVGFAY